MKRKSSPAWGRPAAVFVTMLGVVVQGCASASLGENAAIGVGVGAGVGAAAGKLIAGTQGAWIGAVAGGAIGGVAGYQWAKANEEQKQRAEEAAKKKFAEQPQQAPPQTAGPQPVVLAKADDKGNYVPYNPQTQSPETNTDGEVVVVNRTQIKDTENGSKLGDRNVVFAD